MFARVMWRRATTRIQLLVGLALVLTAIAVASLPAMSLPLDGQVSASANSRTAAASVSYKRARAILLSKVIKPTELVAGDTLIAFRSRRPLARGTRISVFRDRGRAIKIKRRSWFFWIDDDPKAQFEHGTRYVLIDARTGAVKVAKRQWWPLVDGRAPWFASSKYWNSKNWAYSTVIAPTAKIASIGAMSISSAPFLRTAASTAECAVLIDGSGDAKAGFTDDVDGMNTTLGTTFGYTTKKLTKPNNNKADFEKAVGDLVKDGCKDMLLFIAAHGAKGTVDMGSGSYTTADLKALMDKYPTMEFKIVVQACKSGSWVTAFGANTQVKIGLSSTDSEKPSYSADPDTASDPNPADKGSEFTSGLIEDLELIKKTPELQLLVQNCVKGGMPLLACQLHVAFESALAKDEDAAAGREAPQRSP